MPCARQRMNIYGLSYSLQQRELCSLPVCRLHGMLYRMQWPPEMHLPTPHALAFTNALPFTKRTCLDHALLYCMSPFCQQMILYNSCPSTSHDGLPIDSISSVHNDLHAVLFTVYCSHLVSALMVGDCKSRRTCLLGLLLICTVPLLSTAVCFVLGAATRMNGSRLPWRVVCRMCSPGWWLAVKPGQLPGIYIYYSTFSKKHLVRLNHWLCQSAGLQTHIHSVMHAPVCLLFVNIPNACRLLHTNPCSLLLFLNVFGFCTCLAQPMALVSLFLHPPLSPWCRCFGYCIHVFTSDKDAQLTSVVLRKCCTQLLVCGAGTAAPVAGADKCRHLLALPERWVLHVLVAPPQELYVAVCPCWSIRIAVCAIMSLSLL